MGERILRIGRMDADFFVGIKVQNPQKKNPCESAQSVKSVLPLYHTVSQHSEIRNPHSAIHNELVTSPQLPAFIKKLIFFHVFFKIR
jgi:hypothetical protein